MSNSPTLPPLSPNAGIQRKPTPLPSATLNTEGDARLQAALAASARAEASLSGLFRALEQLGNGVGGAREANESLTGELEGLRGMLDAANEQQQLLQVKVEQLELVLDRTRKEYDRERRYLIDQQDLFLVKLLDEQEVELKRRDADLDVLRGRLAELERRQLVTVPPPLVSLPSLEPPAVQLLEPTPSIAASAAIQSELERAEHAELERTAQKLAEDRERARETVQRLQAQRDEAQSAVGRLSKERDEALSQIYRLKAELGGPRTPLSTLPPPSEARHDSAAARALGVAPTLYQREQEARQSGPTAPASSPGSHAEPALPPISSVLNPPPSRPNAAPLPTRLSPPPARLSPQPAKLSAPPEELRNALVGQPAVQSSASSRPPLLKQKPDASTRPLVGYSVSNESIESEHLEGARLVSKPAPPPSQKR